MKKTILAIAAILAVAGSIIAPAVACGGKCKDKAPAPAPAPEKG